MKRQLSVLTMALAISSLAGLSAAGSGTAGTPLPDVSALALPTPVNGNRKVDPSLAGVTGSVDVVVQLSGTPLAVANAEAHRRGARLASSQQSAHTRSLRRSQDAMLARLLSLGGREIGRVQIAYNAVIVRIDAEKLYSIAKYRDVLSVRPVRDYSLYLGETVPHIGAAAAQASGVDGEGVVVAVLDSGIDYTHRNLGGDGTLAAYEAAWGTDLGDPRNTSRDGLFPTDKVIAGHDFLGELWPEGEAVPDDDPIDFGGHGTHVADIIAGASQDGLRKGVAPGAKLVAVKVCSAVSTSCSGAALLQGMDYALDPNGDGSMDDRVHIINLSLGSGYGQVEDDLSLASANAVKAGVVVVASAGNEADRPFILGSPSSATEVLSVAQTQVPSAKAYPLLINAPAALAGQYPNTETMSWAPLDGTTTGDVAYVGRGCLTDPYLADPAGRIALIDRGACNISEKIALATEAGATGVLLALVAAGDAVTFSNGGECPTASGPCVPSLVITLPYATAIKAQLGAGQSVNVTISESVFVPLINSVVGSSSRGPSYSFAAIKPEIGAPGAAVSALVGTGSGEEAFGGTSGAAPVVSGAAALLLSQNSDLTPTHVKALLTNTAETQIYTNPALYPGVLAPITRIGGGEVRADRALAATTAAWDRATGSPALSFGYHAVSTPLLLTRQVSVRNFADTARGYVVHAGYRYADDAASGAVTLSVPSSITVPAHGEAKFTVQLSVNPALLNGWPWAHPFAGGADGGFGALLQSVEYDGYITIADGTDSIHVPWHVLPKKAAEVYSLIPYAMVGISQPIAEVPLVNVSPVQSGRVETFALTGFSKKMPKSKQPAPGDSFALIDLQAVGARLVQTGPGSFGIQFAISTNGRRAHPAYPAEFDVEIDTDLDGVPDYVVFNAELGLLSGAPFSTGQTVVYVADLATGAATAYYYADADLESGNIILTAPLEALGLTPATQFGFSALAFDNYFTGELMDSINGMVMTPGIPRFDWTALPASGIPPQTFGLMNVIAVEGGQEASPSQQGLLLMFRDAKQGLEADVVVVHQVPW